MSYWSGRGRLGRRAAGSLGHHCCPGHLYEHGESRRIVDRQISQHLAVDRHAGQAKALDEAVVGDVVRARGGVDPGDPELTEVALALLAIAVLICRGVEQLLLGLAIETRALA